MAEEELKNTVRFMGHVLTLARGGRPFWFTVIESTRGDLHLRVYRRDFDDKPSRWFGQMSLLTRSDAPKKYADDCVPSRTLLEVDAQGMSMRKAEDAMKRRIAEACKVDVKDLRSKRGGASAVKR